MAKRSYSAGNGDEAEVQQEPATSETGAAKPWAPPDADQEFEFGGEIAAVPAWIDKGWAGADDKGPLLNVPMVDYPAKGEAMRNQPYHTAPARKGDTIKWVEKKRHFEIVPAEPKEEEGEAA